MLHSLAILAGICALFGSSQTGMVRAEDSGASDADFTKDCSFSYDWFFSEVIGGSSDDEDKHKLQRAKAFMAEKMKRKAKKADFARIDVKGFKQARDEEDEDDDDFGFFVAGDACNSISTTLYGTKVGYSWNYVCDGSKQYLRAWENPSCSGDEAFEQEQPSQYKGWFWDCGDDNCKVKFNMESPCDDPDFSVEWWFVKEQCISVNNSAIAMTCVDNSQIWINGFSNSDDCIDYDGTQSYKVFENGCDEDEDIDIQIKCNSAFSVRGMAMVSLFVSLVASFLF